MYHIDISLNALKCSHVEAGLLSVPTRTEAAVLMRCFHMVTMGDADRMRLDQIVLQVRKAVVADMGRAGDV